MSVSLCLCLCVSLCLLAHVPVCPRVSKCLSASVVWACLCACVPLCLRFCVSVRLCASVCACLCGLWGGCCLSVCLSACLLVCLSDCLPVGLSLRPSVSPSVCLSLSLSLSLSPSLSLSVCLCRGCLSVSVRLSVGPSVGPPVCLSCLCPHPCLLTFRTSWVPTAKTGTVYGRPQVMTSNAKMCLQVPGMASAEYCSKAMALQSVFGPLSHNVQSCAREVNNVNMLRRMRRIQSRQRGLMLHLVSSFAPQECEGFRLLRVHLSSTLAALSRVLGSHQ